MKTKTILAGISLLCISLPAHAIPPPDAVISLWQSLLQFIGVASVFIGGAILSVRQFFSHYIVGWKRTAFYLSLVVGFLVILWLMLGPRIAKAESSTQPFVQGEQLPITQLIKREKEAWIRDWKLDTIQEMQHELNLSRQRKQLAPIAFQTVQSFTPKQLHNLIETQSQQVYVLDIREEYERSRFSIESNGSARYGDLVANLIPDELPKDSVIVVLCHSGMRGYLGANLLKRAGFTRAAFLQDGLASWHDNELPIRGTVDYKAKKRWQPSARQARKLDAFKMQVDAEGSSAIRNIPNLIKLPYETATTQELTQVMQTSKRRPILLACNTYGGCFHSTNLAWLIEHNGGKVAGIYDETGDHLENFF